MPKATHFHQVHDAMNTDAKTSPGKGILKREKQHFQESEDNKKSAARSEQEFMHDQDKQTEQSQEENDEE